MAFPPTQPSRMDYGSRETHATSWKEAFLSLTEGEPRAEYDGERGLTGQRQQGGFIVRMNQVKQDQDTKPCIFPPAQGPLVPNLPPFASFTQPSPFQKMDNG